MGGVAGWPAIPYAPHQVSSRLDQNCKNLLFGEVSRWVGWVVGVRKTWAGHPMYFFLMYPSKNDFHAKFHQHWTTIIEVSPSNQFWGVDGVVGMVQN